MVPAFHQPVAAVFVDPVSKDAMHRVSTTQPDRSAFRTCVGVAHDLTGSADLSGSTRVSRVYEKTIKLHR
ncbi:MAG: hypothetical protein LBL04_01325 [Bacteroidales bacterium]|nr:hypothetical protein [Bacteroidales bacterium]